MAAAANGHSAVVALLVDRGANINARDYVRKRAYMHSYIFFIYVQYENKNL